MKMIQTNCPNCHGQMKIDRENNTAVCPFCGTSVLIDDETQHVQYDNAEDAGYNFEKGRQRAKLEAEAEQRQRYAYQQAQYRPQPQQVYVPVQTAQPKKKSGGCLKVILIIIILQFALGALSLIFASVVGRTAREASGLSESEDKNVEYVKTLDDITPEMEAALYADAHEVYRETILEECGDQAQVTLAEYAGFYMVVPEDNDDVENYMYIVIHANVDYSPDGTEPIHYDYYWYLRYTDVVISEDGTEVINDDTETLIVEHYLEPEHEVEWIFSGTGYYSIQEFYDTEIAPNGESCYIDTSIDLGTPAEEAAPEGEAPAEGEAPVEG